MKMKWRSISAIGKKFGTWCKRFLVLFRDSNRTEVSDPNRKGTDTFRSVGMKLFIIFFISIMLFVMIIGFSSYQISKTVIQKQVSETSVQTMVQLTEKLDLVFTNIEDISLRMLMDKELQSWLLESNSNKLSPIESFNLFRNIGDKVYTSQVSNAAIRSIYFLRIDGVPLKLSSNMDKDNYTDEPWFKEVVQKEGQNIWLGVKKGGYSSNADSLALGRLMRDPSTGMPSAIMLIEIDKSIITNQLKKLDLGGELYFDNANGQHMFTMNMDELDKPSKIKFTKKQLQSNQGSFLGSEGKELVIYAKSQRTGWYSSVSIPVKQLVKGAESIFNLTMIMLFVALLIAVAIGYFVARLISKPMVRMRNLMQRGAEGDLTVRSNMKSRDELGQLGQSFDQMMGQITELVKKTNQSALEVFLTAEQLSRTSKSTAIAAKEVAVATEEISGGAAGLSLEAERGNDFMQDMGSRVKEVIAANSIMGGAATIVQSSSEQGIGYMSQLIAKTNSTEEMTISMSEKVNKLKESTRSIRTILDMLSGISRQTNILSLNATIEAARAGSAGKGFMVVADEIRKLADQSRQSIAVVGEITETIQSEIDQTVTVLAAASPIFNDQIVAVKEADLIFNQVHEKMSGFISQLSSVSDSIQTLEQSQLVLADAMANVSAVSEESLATSEQVASLSAEQLNVSEGLVQLSNKLEHLSNELKDSLAKFTVV